jgi:tRNA A37 N6-isopentenylltransferase MiaA
MLLRSLSGSAALVRSGSCEEERQTVFANVLTPRGHSVSESASILDTSQMQILGGLLAEARALRDAGLRANQNSATRAIGYRQGLKWLERISACRTATADDVRQLALDIQGPSRRLHKAQVTFHRNLEQFHWVDARQGPVAAAAYIEEQFRKCEHQGVGFRQLVCVFLSEGTSRRHRVGA